MTDEELKRKAEEYAIKEIPFIECITQNDLERLVQQAYIAGATENGIQWHKVADGDLPKGEEYGKDSIHRDIYLKDRYGNLYTGNYFPKDNTHKEDCFAVEYLEWGFQGSQFCKKEQIAEWCEIPQ
jgi:hypothetical protein